MPDHIFHKMAVNGNNYFITNRKNFVSVGALPEDIVSASFNFAYQMTFGGNGEHRAHRTGGTHQRRSGEIFANAFQGKLAEFSLYLLLRNAGIEVTEPDLNVFGLGEWDSVDLTIGDCSLSIKSTKSFGNLLLLEEQDWDDDANYLPNGKGYDFTFLVRMAPYCEDLMKQNHLFYSDFVAENTLYRIVSSESWQFDIPGFVTRDDLIYIIRSEYLMQQGAMLNGRTRMDASNYYIQAGDMRPISEFLIN